MTTFSIGDKFTIRGGEQIYTLRSYNQVNNTYEIYSDRYGDRHGTDYDPDEMNGYFEEGVWTKVESDDIPVGKKIRANFEGSMWILVTNDDGTYDLAYPVGDARFGQRTTNRFTRDQIKDVLRTGTWSVIDDERVTLEPTDDISPADQERDHIIERLRSELAILQNERDSIVEQNEQRRISFLEYLAEVAENPSAHGVDETRMCQNFDAAMIRHGHYSRSEVNAARHKAAPEVLVMVSMSRRISVPREDVYNRSVIWQRMLDNGMVDEYLIDDITDDTDRGSVA